jgi:hypothetical protein
MMDRQKKYGDDELELLLHCVYASERSLKLEVQWQGSLLHFTYSTFGHGRANLLSGLATLLISRDDRDQNSPEESNDNVIPFPNGWTSHTAHDWKVAA